MTGLTEVTLRKVRHKGHACLPSSVCAANNAAADGGCDGQVYKELLLEHTKILPPHYTSKVPSAASLARVHRFWQAGFPCWHHGG